MKKKRKEVETYLLAPFLPFWEALLFACIIASPPEFKLSFALALQAFLASGPDSGCDMAHFLLLFEVNCGGDWVCLAPEWILWLVEWVSGMVMVCDGIVGGMLSIWVVEGLWEW